ncbi:hypothetical protein KM1_236060, partial [Entamoeba histolytica HM-3:IMSS]
IFENTTRVSIPFSSYSNSGSIEHSTINVFDDLHSPSYSIFYLSY